MLYCDSKYRIPMALSRKHAALPNRRRNRVHRSAAYHPNSAVPVRAGTARRDSGSGTPPARVDAVAAFRFRDPDLTPSTRQEGEVRITPAPLRKLGRRGSN